MYFLGVCCDLLKIHYLCGDKDNLARPFILTKRSCDLLKIHYLCGDKDNMNAQTDRGLRVVICSKFITFAVTKTIKSTLRTHHYQL